jgi:hypothetical protein
MFRFLVFVPKPDTGGGQRVNLASGWSYDETEAEAFGDVMPTVRGMIQAIGAALEIDSVREFGTESDSEEAAPAWAVEVMTEAGVDGLNGSWVELDGKPLALVVAVGHSLTLGEDEMARALYQASHE